MVDGVVLCMALISSSEKPIFFRNADGVQIIELAGAVVAVAAVGVGRPDKQPIFCRKKIKACREMFCCFDTSPIEKNKFHDNPLTL